MEVKNQKSKKLQWKILKHFTNRVSEAKQRSKYGGGLKILTPKPMLQRLPIAFAQVETVNTSENLLN